MQDTVREHLKIICLIQLILSIVVAFIKNDLPDFSGLT